MLKHKKQSVADDTASTAEIKGADWNAEHCYGAGSLVPVGLMVVRFDGTGFVSATGFGGFSGVSRVQAGYYFGFFEVLSPAVIADGCDVAYISVVSPSPSPPALSSLLISSSASDYGDVELSITDAALATVDPDVVTSIFVTVYASISVTTPPEA